MTLEVARSTELSEDELRRISRIEYFEQKREWIMQKYLGTPILVHTTRGFWMQVRKNISHGESPPFFGILNPCDKEGNMVLLPWVRRYDRGLLISSILAGSNKAEPLISMTEMDHLCRGVDEFTEGVTSEDYPAELLRRSPRGLKIPWTELVMIGRAVEFLPNRGQDQG